MADNTPEINSDMSTEHQSENPSNEIPTTDTETNNLNQETKNMEVHHHAHDPAAPHHKKNWKNYFWEFLMLFLAVFCGFLAEYQLEQTIEHHREEQYVNSLINDIKSDTAAAQLVINDFKRIYPGLDSMVEGFEDAMKGKSELYYRNMRAIGGFEDFYLSDGTMQQLKNAGGLRLIRNRTALDSILKYDAYTKDIMNQQTYLADKVFQKVFDLQKECVDNLKIGKLVAEFRKTNKAPSPGYIFSTKDYQKLNEYYSSLVSLRFNVRYWINEMEKLKGQGGRLVTTLEREYEIE